MVLLIYHFDKNNAATEWFTNETLRLDLGFFPKQNTYIKLRQVSFSTKSRGGTLHLDFPDVESSFLTTEKHDYSDRWENRGMIFIAKQGEFGLGGDGDFSACSDHLDMNLNLGEMDTQKDSFTIIVNGRRGVDSQGSVNYLSNVSLVFEMSHHNRHT